MARIVVRWGFVPAVLAVIAAGVAIDRVIESIAVACVLFVVGTWLRRLVAA